MMRHIASMDLNVFWKTKSRLDSRNWPSHGNWNSLSLLASGNMPQFIDPVFIEASSGLNAGTTASRSSTDIPASPPVVMQMTTSSFFALIPSTIRR